MLSSRNIMPHSLWHIICVPPVELKNQENSAFSTHGCTVKRGCDGLQFHYRYLQSSFRYGGIFIRYFFLRVFWYDMPMLFHKRVKRTKCSDCRGTGLRWGWWTILITLPLGMLLEVVLHLIPLIVLFILIVVGIAFYSNKFEILYYLITFCIAVPAIWYGTKLIFPRCRSCDGKGSS
jgi:hypothetical protein